jgi:hypothetical protein
MANYHKEQALHIRGFQKGENEDNIEKAAREAGKKDYQVETQHKLVIHCLHRTFAHIFNN